MSGWPGDGNTGDGPWLWAGGGAGARPPRAAAAPDALPDAVLFDRDGTLVVDVPYNGDPERVRPMPGARAAVAQLRGLGVPVGVVSNQSGVARGLLTRQQVGAVRRRVDALFGPFDLWAVCPHGPEDGCGCRKPGPGLVLAACELLGAEPRRTVVVGDIGADVQAARAAGARSVLVPTPATRPEEVAAAEASAADLPAAVRLILAPAAPQAAPKAHGSGPAPEAGGTPGTGGAGGAGGVFKAAGAPETAGAAEADRTAGAFGADRAAGAFGAGRASGASEASGVGGGRGVAGVLPAACGAGRPGGAG